MQSIERKILFRSHLKNFRKKNFSIEEIKAQKNISLEEFNCWKNTGATVLGIKTSEGEFSLNPVSETVIRAGNRVILMGAKEQLKKAAELLK